MKFRAKRILLPTDFSALSLKAVPLAVRLLERGGVLRLLYVEQPVMAASVVGPEMAVPVYDPSASKRAAAAALRHLQGIVRQTKGVKVEAKVLEGAHPAKVIMAESKRFRADLLCLCTHGKSAVKRMLYGSVTHKLLTHYKGSMLLLKPH
jgi:nucleotide-binding universal stress UspA family protein